MIIANDPSLAVGGGNVISDRVSYECRAEPDRSEAGGHDEQVDRGEQIGTADWSSYANVHDLPLIRCASELNARLSSALHYGSGAGASMMLPCAIALRRADSRLPACRACANATDV